MRNVGPGQWREWRWGNQTVPLYMPDPKAPVPEGQKPVSEIAFLTMRALMAANCLPKLTEEVAELIAKPDEEDGRVTEERLRECFKTVGTANLSKEELEIIWPAPVVDTDSQPSSRRGSKLKIKRSTSKDKPVPTDDG